VGVWVGQPDGSFITDNSGRNSAVPLLNKILAIIPSQFHATIEQPITVSQQNICWPLGYKENHQQAEECQVKKAAYLLEDMAPPTFSDPMSLLFSTDKITMLVDETTGLRVTPECANGNVKIKQQTVWPLVLDNWLPQHLKRDQVMPRLSPGCQLSASNNQLTVLGIHDNAVIFPEVSALTEPNIQLELAGSNGDVYWFLNGLLVEQFGSQITLENLSEGKYLLQVIDSSANQTAINFEVHM
jgi:penicillin-binding protein 1C